MDTVVVLVHSPSVGPSTWAPVAARLTAAGVTAVVPSLLGVGGGDPPYHPRVAAAVETALRPVGAGRPRLLVPHSNAGLFAPVLAAAAGPVTGCLFADAALPAAAGSTPVAAPGMLGFLRPLAEDGRLPPWTDWWAEADVAALLPDPDVRAAVRAEQPRLPLAWYEQSVPVPPGWDDGLRGGYLRFSEAYEPVAAEAAARGWPVWHEPGGHLHQMVDPDAVAARIIGFAGG